MWLPQVTGMNGSWDKFLHLTLTGTSISIIFSGNKKTGLILTTYCVRYPHAVPFLQNEIPFSLLKTLKTHAV